MSRDTEDSSIWARDSIRSVVYCYILHHSEFQRILTFNAISLIYTRTNHKSKCLHQGNMTGRKMINLDFVQQGIHNDKAHSYSFMDT